ncbi:glycosyltransferase family 87 protein [Sneathiella sp.]|uniref:glycosyltransferase family 87 protein n=1 Tax=Sneathiella sp. TaxID=1964365 RepID=UPI002FE236CE
MYYAAWVRLFEPDSDLYQTVFFGDTIKFQYPPISLLPIMPFVAANVEEEVFFYYMGYLAIAAVLISGYVIYRIILAASALFYGTGFSNKGWNVFAFGLSLVGTLTYYPIVFGIYLGQVQVFLNMIVCFAMWALVVDRKTIAGVLIAFAALIKPQFLLFLVWSLLRRQHRFTRGMIAVFVPAGVASLYVFGWQAHLDYVSVISFIGRHGEVYWPNQSMNGLLNRLLSGADPMVFSTADFAPYNGIVYIGTLVSTAVLIVIALFFIYVSRRDSGENKTRRGKCSEVLDFSVMLVVSTIASPIAWEHHYGALWPVIIVALMIAISAFRTSPSWQTAIAVALVSGSYLLVSNYFYFIVEKYTLRLAPWNIVQSYIYFGGLMLLLSLIMLYRMPREKVLDSAI